MPDMAVHDPTWGFVALGPALAVACALCIDRLFGEPPARCHPVVWMGRYLGAVGKHIAPASTAGSGVAGTRERARPFAGGALAWSVGAIAAAALGALMAQLATRLHPLAAALLLGLLLKPLLAWRMLRDEVLAVEAALAGSLDAGRAQLARLVSRDVHALTAEEVRESAIESLAENLNDSVVAPIFWFLLLGLPGAAVYRFANTADAMWGYIGLRNGRDWTWAGKWAARADDVLSWVPARLSALLLLVAFGRRGWRRLRTEARRTPSPNSGWPMAAMALQLGIRLGKPGVYTLNAAGRRPSAQDVAQAVAGCSRALGLLAIGLLPGAVLLACSHRL